jgi:uncharacterized protein
MNIPGFALPEYFSKPWKTDFNNINFWYDAVITVLFEGKMRALFSMIFGVGILLFTAKKEKSGWAVTGLYYKRMGWLILFGLIDAHVLLWFGDILYLYGVCGLIAYLFRKMKPIYLALGVPVVAILGFTASTFFYQNIRTQLLAYNDAKAAQTKNITLSAQQQKALINWEAIRKEFIPNTAEAAEHTKKIKGNYNSAASYLRPEAFKGETKFLIFGIGDPLALMLLGMALFKWGFLSGTWSKRKYLNTILIGYGIGLPLVIYNYYFNVIHYPTVAAGLERMAVTPISWIGLIYPFQRIFLVLAHSSVLILILQSGALKGFMQRLAAVGRMAFTNYVMHTVICTLVFFGYGLNYYAEWQYYQLYYLVIIIWLLQLWLSPLWLKYYLFGPLEWCWRSLTYWQRQPFKRNKKSEV